LLIILLFCTFIANGDLRAKILGAQWHTDSNKLDVTLQSPTHNAVCQTSPTAIGHFTIDDNNGHRQSFSDSAILVNGYDPDKVADCRSYNGVNPFTYTVDYDPNSAPSQGSTVLIALSIYYMCSTDEGSTNNYIYCTSCDVKFESQFPN